MSLTSSLYFLSSCTADISKNIVKKETNKSVSVLDLNNIANTYPKTGVKVTRSTLSNIEGYEGKQVEVFLLEWEQGGRTAMPVNKVRNVSFKNTLIQASRTGARLEI